ncbi:hypothetical protein ACFYXH_10775 [Streptomyces sp. NPDC002730]|uniref:hypothetical protein n=1 Tax=Streptomyces sp. NPDC002730 TaxID=3364662 RepID=UPI0036C1C51A
MAGGVVVAVLRALRDADQVNHGVHVRHRQPLWFIAVRAAGQGTGGDRRRVHGLPQVLDVRTSCTAVLLDQFPQPALLYGPEVDVPVDGDILPATPGGQADQGAFPHVTGGWVGTFELDPGAADMKQYTVQDAGGSGRET